MISVSDERLDAGEVALNCILSLRTPTFSQWKATLIQLDVDNGKPLDGFKFDLQYRTVNSVAEQI